MRHRPGDTAVATITPSTVIRPPLTRPPSYQGFRLPAGASLSLAPWRGVGCTRQLTAHDKALSVFIRNLLRDRHEDPEVG